MHAAQSQRLERRRVPALVPMLARNPRGVHRGKGFIWPALSEAAGLNGRPLFGRGDDITVVGTLQKRSRGETGSQLRWELG